MTCNARKSSVRGKGCVSTKTPLIAFKAQIEVYGHKFVLVTNKEISELEQKGWFDSIMEVICLK